MPRMIPVALIALALSACVPIATPVPPAPTATMQPTPIDYQRSGGFIGVQDHLTIDLNGHVTLTRRNGTTEFDLSRDELGTIQAAFQTAGFAALPENPTPQGFAADGFTYVINYEGHQVRTGDPSVPKQLQPVISLLNRMIDSRGK
jgi:hypothetical protein